LNFEFLIGMQLENKHSFIILISLILLGSVLRFYNLNWGAPYYFHPDERNIASAVSQLSFPDQLNPHFFAYGSLPIYVIFFKGLLLNFFTSCQFSLNHCQVKLEQAIVLSRMLSSLFSLLLIPLLFFIGKKLYSNTAGLVVAALATFSIGFIQFAHFGTYEMSLTFFGTLLFYLLLLRGKYSHVKHSAALGIVMGILVSLKI
jgi:4-amino-4-deoxy-L-arabinose transferase-like glycosyltransferase